jgi:hypothetical protein
LIAGIWNGDRFVQTLGLMVSQAAYAAKSFQLSAFQHLTLEGRAAASPNPPQQLTSLWPRITRPSMGESWKLKTEIGTGP